MAGVEPLDLACPRRVGKIRAQYFDEAPRGANAGDPLQELYADQAYPATSIGIDQTVAASSAWQVLSKHSGVPHSENWRLVGPSTGNVPGPEANRTIVGRWYPP